MSSLSRATILLAHGSSDPRWTEPFALILEHVRSHLQKNPQLSKQERRVELAFMELAQPSLSEQATRLAEEGFAHIDVVPLFFAQGRHLREDVPRQLETLQQQLKDAGTAASLFLHLPVGLEAEVMNAIATVVLQKMEIAQ